MFKVLSWLFQYWLLWLNFAWYETWFLENILLLQEWTSQSFTVNDSRQPPAQQPTHSRRKELDLTQKKRPWAAQDEIFGMAFPFFPWHNDLFRRDKSRQHSHEDTGGYLLWALGRDSASGLYTEIYNTTSSIPQYIIGLPYIIITLQAVRCTHAIAWVPCPNPLPI